MEILSRNWVDYAEIDQFKKNDKKNREIGMIDNIRETVY